MPCRAVSCQLGEPSPTPRTLRPAAGSRIERQYPRKKDTMAGSRTTPFPKKSLFFLPRLLLPPPSRSRIPTLHTHPQSPRRAAPTSILTIHPPSWPKGWSSVRKWKQNHPCREPRARRSTETHMQRHPPRNERQTNQAGSPATIIDIESWA